MDLMSKIVDKPDVFQISLPKVEGAEAFLDDIVKRNTQLSQTGIIFEAVRSEEETIEAYADSFILSGCGDGSTLVINSKHIISKNLKTGEEERTCFKYYSPDSYDFFDAFLTLSTAGLYLLGRSIFNHTYNSRKDRIMLSKYYDQKVKEYKAKNLQEAQETAGNILIYKEPIEKVEFDGYNVLSTLPINVGSKLHKPFRDLKLKVSAYLSGADAVVGCSRDYSKGTLVMVSKK